MEGINKADKSAFYQKAIRILDSIKSEDVPCIFISYQRDDEDYAKEVAQYIIAKQLDVYFDLNDDDLKLQNQKTDPEGVTNAIQKGLNESQYMIVILSPDTYKSPWVPFEIGYAYDRMGKNLKLLRHKDLPKNQIPSYLQVKEVLNGTESLNKFLQNVRSRYMVYETLLVKGEKVKSFSSFQSNPLNKYLANE